MGVIEQIFSYPFMVRALIVGLIISLCAALLGSSLVLKRYSMIGDGLSHVGFAALAVAYAFNAAPLAVSIPVCVVAAFILLQVQQNTKVSGDAALAIMCASALAIGVVTVSLSTGMNTDISNYLFGSILATSTADVGIAAVVGAIVVIFFIVFYNRIFAISFDEDFAKASGSKTQMYNVVLSILIALTVVLGMRMMGALLISALIVFPAMTAMRICKCFKSTIVFSVIDALICFSVGMVVSYLASIPTGACIVLVNLIAFLISVFVGIARGK